MDTSGYRPKITSADNSMRQEPRGGNVPDIAINFVTSYDENLFAIEKLVEAVV